MNDNLILVLSGMKVVNETGTYYFDKPGEWIVNGKVTTERLHREDGPAVEYVNGSRYWYKNGHRHREGGPAVVHTGGYTEWWQHGVRHREDGPAVVHANGTKEWWQHGIQIGNSNG